jgi:hypothetical protein
MLTAVIAAACVTDHERVAYPVLRFTDEAIFRSFSLGHVMSPHRCHTQISDQIIVKAAASRSTRFEGLTLRASVLPPMLVDSSQRGPA